MRPNFENGNIITEYRYRLVMKTILREKYLFLVFSKKIKMIMFAKKIKNKLKIIHVSN